MINYSLVSSGLPVYIVPPTIEVNDAYQIFRQ